MRTRHEATAVAVLYTLAHGLMLLNRGLFWDDWIYFRQPRAHLIELGRQLGTTWPDFTSWLPYGSPFSIWATRVVMFACFLGVALLALRLSRRIGYFDAQTRVAFASLVGVFPVVASRDPAANFIYPISLLLFMAGWVLLDHAIDATGWRMWVSRLTALAAFFLSFRTASLGLFFIVVIAWVLWRSGVSWRRPREALLRILTWADVVSLPAVFWAFRVLMAMPYGLAEDYNVVTWKRFKAARHLVPQALWDAFVQAFARMPAVAWWPVVLLAAAAAGIALWSMASDPMSRGTRWRATVTWLATAAGGLALVVLGVYPYLTVKKLPEFSEFLSRHQLLVPFGAALIIVGLIRALTDALGTPAAVRVGLFAVVIALSVGTDVGDHLSYQREWYKQLGMIEAFRRAPEMRDARGFLFVDHAKDLNINDRVWRRDYEYAGMFAEVFDTHDRFGTDLRHYAKRGAKHYATRYIAAFKAEDYSGAAPQYLVTIDRGDVDLRRDGVLARMMWDEWTGAPTFMQRVARTVRVTYEPFE